MAQGRGGEGAWRSGERPGLRPESLGATDKAAETDGIPTGESGEVRGKAEL